MAKKKKEPAKPWNPSPRIRAFLAAYRATASITRAAKAAKISRFAHYRLAKRSPEYKAVFRDSHEVAGDVLEDEAIRRGNEGILKPKFYHGVLITVPKNPSDPDCDEFVPYLEREYSDTLLLATLKKFKPEYRDRLDLQATVTNKKFEGTFEELLAMYRDMTKKSEGDDE